MNELPRVLVVEDSPTQSKAIAAQISRYEIDVFIANDGPQGLRLASKHNPDLILLDINLPTMNGFQVCRRLKRDENTAHIPVIILTAADALDDIKQGFEAGAANYITKDEFAAERLTLTLQSMGLTSS